MKITTTGDRRKSERGEESTRITWDIAGNSTAEITTPMRACCAVIRGISASGLIKAA